MERTLNRNNIEATISDYESSIETIGDTLSGLRGIPLFQSLKRNRIGLGPYPHVTLFEAANRIMTDLVILKGVKWLLDTHAFPFDEYVVEYGNEDSNDHDITAHNGSKRLIGEAFNVAPSLFQCKKNAMRKKLRGNKDDADFMIVVANADAVNDNYAPKMEENEYYIFVNVESVRARLLSKNSKLPDHKDTEMFEALSDHTTELMREIDNRFKSETGITERRYYKIFYSHVHSFPLLILGLNPGGETDGTDLAASNSYFENYEHDFVCFRNISQYSLARPMCELLSMCLETNSVSYLRQIPSTNVIFRRSRNSSKLNISVAKAAIESAPYLSEIVNAVSPKVILFVSKTAYDSFIKNHCVKSSIQENQNSYIYTPNGRNKACIYLESSGYVKVLGETIPLAMVGHPSKYSGRAEWPPTLKCLKAFFSKHGLSPISQVTELKTISEIPSYGATL